MDLFDMNLYVLYPNTDVDQYQSVKKDVEWWIEFTPRFNRVMNGHNLMKFSVLTAL